MNNCNLKGAKMDTLSGHASRCQREGREFESRFPLQFFKKENIGENYEIFIFNSNSFHESGIC